MTKILLKDPRPNNVNVSNEQEFEWGYSAEDRLEYMQHAEKFYHLFCSRYTYKELTPYMMKLIDQVPELMLTLPFPVARFQSEGGEHLNYLHNCFYFQHTTRHGGRGKPDPIVAVFQACWNRLYHEITQLSLSEHGADNVVGQSFTAYCTCHTAAAVIQRYFKGYIVRKKLKISGWTLKPMSGQQKKTNSVAKRDIERFFPKELNNKYPIAGNNFVLVGAIQGKRKMTQADLKKMIVEKGGRVKNAIPFRQKGISTKKYTVLTTKDYLEKKKVPSVIKVAIRRKCHVLSYQYILRCLEECGEIDREEYKLDTTKISPRITKELTIGKNTFTRRKHSYPS